MGQTLERLIVNMEYTFNELSLDLQQPITENDALKFASICVGLFSKGFRIMKITDRNQFLSHPLTTYSSIGEWIKSNPADRNEKILLARFKNILAASSKVIDKESIELIDACPLIYIDVSGNQISPKGLKIACILKTFSISFSMAQTWSNPIIEALWVEEDKKAGIIEQYVKIKHLSEGSHFAFHEDWILLQVRSNKLFSGWKPDKEFFPNLNFSNELVMDSNWDQYREKFRNASTETRKFLILDYGRNVAERNFYTHDVKLSGLNSSANKKRVIYYAGTGKHRIYLSIDMETGGFEVCDYMGYHLGEYFYDGSKRKKASLGHGINVS